jgi:hypothetical protein
MTWRLLARENAGRGGQVTVHLDDGHLNVVVHESDATVGRYRDSEICWVSVGEIQEAPSGAPGSNTMSASSTARPRATRPAAPKSATRSAKIAAHNPKRRGTGWAALRET